MYRIVHFVGELVVGTIILNLGLVAMFGLIAKYKTWSEVRRNSNTDQYRP